MKEYLACLTKGYGDTVMLAYGGGSVKKNGVYDEVTAILNGAGKEIVEFPGIMANVTYAKVLEGAEVARKHHVGLILAVGGGSVMDCCKAISMTVRYEGNLWENFWARPGIFDFEPLPLGVVATAAGSGSECNGRSVITNEALMVKTGRDYPKCNPKFALMDPVYTYSIPQFQMICNGFAVLSHIMESYLGGPDEDNVSDDLAVALMKNVIRSLRRAVRNPEDYTARGNLMWAGAMAENRIIRLGKPDQFQCRQMAYQLEAYTGCSHGAGLAVLLPVYCRHIYTSGLAKFKRFAVEVWGITPGEKTEEETACAGIDGLADFIREIGLPADLRELGVDENTDLRAIADSSAMVSGSCTRLTQEEILRIFQECYGEDC